MTTPFRVLLALLLAVALTGSAVLLVAIGYMIVVAVKAILFVGACLTILTVAFYIWLGRPAAPLVDRR